MPNVESQNPPARQRKPVDPCPKCRVHRERCICAGLVPIKTRTRLAVIAHHRELKRTTNTGRLAVHALENASLIARGQTTERLDLSHLLDPGYESVILYPADDALELSELSFVRPVQLIVADGNWRQAGKVHRRHPELAALRRVKLTAVNTGLQHLRREHFAEGFSTLEAIAMAFGILEGAVAEAHLRDIYRAKLRATIEGRGQVFGADPGLSR